MGTPKLPVILTEADWTKKKTKLAPLAKEKGVGKLITDVKLLYKQVNWKAFNAQQALGAANTAEQLKTQLKRGKLEYKKVPLLGRKLKDLGTQAAASQAKLAKNECIAKDVPDHLAKVAKAAKLFAAQVQGTKTDYTAFEAEARRKQALAKRGELEHEDVSEVEKLVEEEGRPLEKEVVDEQEHRTFQREEILDRTEKLKPSKQRQGPDSSGPQFGVKGALSKEDTLRGLLANPKQFTTRNFNLDLRGSNLAGADLAEASLADANLSGANLSGAKLGKAFLSHTNLRRANLSNADLREVNGLRAILAGADLSGAYLGDAQLISADLRQATLTSANLPGTNLTSAVLRGADLTGANLRGASLTGADLSDADLSGADLRGAALKGTKFNGATLDGANLEGVEGLTVKQLAKAGSLKSVTLPDGSKSQ